MRSFITFVVKQYFLFVSRSKLHTCNIDYCFFDILAHIAPISIQKGAQPKPRTEKRKLQLSPNNPFIV